MVGTTHFGDPKILVTVRGPHPKAGFQLLLKSTASMDHKAEQLAKTGKTSYLISSHPDPHDRSWHGAVEGVTLANALSQVASYIDWMWEREQVRDTIETGGIQEHLERFGRGLWEDSAIDYKLEWQDLMNEVARVNLIMATLEAGSE